MTSFKDFKVRRTTQYSHDFIKFSECNLTINEVCDTPITNNHGGTHLQIGLKLSKPKLSPDQDLQYVVETNL